MPSTNQVLLWAPRVLGIAAALFLAMFALDVIGEPGTVIEKSVALLMHLIPAGLVAASVAIAWRSELAGAAAFAAVAAAYVLFFWGRFPWVVYVAITGPLLLTCLLFVASWASRHRRRVA
jgi:hypothetical protein